MFCPLRAAPLPKPGAVHDQAGAIDRFDAFAPSGAQRQPSATVANADACLRQSEASKDVASAHLLELPGPLLGAILAYTGLQPHLQASAACTVLNDAVTAQATHLRLKNPAGLKALLAKYPNIRTVEFGTADVEREENWGALEVLTQFPKVNSLMIERNNFRNEDLAFLGKLEHLENFSLKGNIALDEGGLRHLGNQSNLRSLELRTGFCKLTRAGIKSIGTLEQLRILRISNSIRLNNETLLPFSDLKNLEELELGTTGKISREDIRTFRGLSSLRTLRLSGLTIDDSMITALAALPALKTLKSDNCRQLTAAGMLEIGNLENLEELRLCGSLTITDADLAHLSCLKKLTRLEVEDCPGISGNALSERREALKR